MRETMRRLGLTPREVRYLQDWPDSPAASVMRQRLALGAIRMDAMTMAGLEQAREALREEMLDSEQCV